MFKPALMNMRNVAMLPFGACIVLFLAVFFPWTCFASPYGRPVEEELVDAPVILVGKVNYLMGKNCLSGHVEFVVKGEAATDFLFCALDEYALEVHMVNIRMAYDRNKDGLMVFFMKKAGTAYAPAFHADSIAFFTDKKCIIFPGVFDEKKRKYILEPSQIFLKRFNFNAPSNVKSDSNCDDW